MKLFIFGASGGTGLELTKQALQRGHQVTAFVRQARRMPQEHPNLTLAIGDVLNPTTLTGQLHGYDAVLCSLGMPARKTGNLRSLGTANIIREMRAAGVNRFICQTSLGYGDGKAVLRQTGFVFRRIIVPFLLRKGFADHALQESYIRNSGLNWTIIRPGNLTDGALTKTYQHGFSATQAGLKVSISRADVAHFMLEQLGSKRYLCQTPGISY